MEEHSFGGPWTEIKLEILKKYLKFYTTALKDKSFELLYIDAFAGTGSRTSHIPSAPIFAREEQKVTLDGSARIALTLEQPFDRYLFIEENTERFKELEKIRAEFPDKYIKIEKSDANPVLAELAAKPVWDSNKYRGVIFLDPYGLQVSWDTLKAISATKSFDVWYLFPISGVCRQAAKDHAKVEDYKKESLDKLFGTREWEKAFYATVTRPGLFETKEETRRKSTIQQMEEWVSNRLKEIFPYVSAPAVLPKTGAQLYSLYFCVANPEPKAIGLAKKAADFILNSY
jgi:three-Cys-motif partner protein